MKLRSEPPPRYEATPDDGALIQRALALLTSRARTGPIVGNPADVKAMARLHFAGAEREQFAVMLLDSQNRLIETRTLFEGTINQTAVYPRELARVALLANAAAVILAHNHPSGNPEPSRADEHLTRSVAQSLGLFDIRVLDHIVVGNPDVVSFAERGLL